MSGEEDPGNSTRKESEPVVQVDAEIGRTKAELYAALVELARLSAERDRLSCRVRELTSALRDALTQAVNRNRGLAELQRQLSGEGGLSESVERVRAEVHRRGHLLNRAASAVQAFRSRMDGDLRQYRGQRAWKIMLFFRKAYTLAVRQGWAGRLKFTLGLLGLRPGTAGGLQAYELQFPDILTYVPEELLGLPADHAGAEDGAGDRSPRYGTPVSPRCARPLARHDVVILPVFEFDFRMQRPQHLAEQFALKGHRVFWISPTRAPSPSCEKPYEVVELRDNLWEVHLRMEQPNVYLGRLSGELVEEYSACLQELYRDCAIAASCVLVQLPFWRRLALALRDSFGAKIVYDCMDDWEAMPNVGEFTRSEDGKLARESDTLVVTSRRLLEKHSQHGLSPALVRNGVDFELFSAARGGSLLAQIRTPVVGYFGAIAEWFDYDLFCLVARSRPEYSFVLIGGLGLEAEATGEMVRRLGTLQNVHLLGHKPYALMPSYLAEFDVCIVPFVLDQVTAATDPVKLYEYLSQGKPVVTTAMGELAEFGDLAYVASDARDFSQKLDAALHEQDTDLKLRRIRFASENTWSLRISAVESALLKSFPMVSVVIVTHNSAEYVTPCLDSLRRNTSYPRWEVVVVDNDSGDGTADLVEQTAAVDSRIHLIRQPSNTGFAAGNNIGVRAAQGEYLVLLNMDTVVTPGWMDRLIRHARKDVSVGMVVPVTNCAGNEVRIDVRYADLLEMEKFSLELARDNMGIGLDIRVGPLFCSLVPRAVWEKVGELDERFEVGMFEDDDYSHRLAKAGYRIVSAEDCFVHHFGQGAFSKLAQQRYEEIFDQNRRRFEEKWGFSWIPHKYRPGVTGEGRRLTPAELVEPQGR